MVQLEMCTYNEFSGVPFDIELKMDFYFLKYNFIKVFEIFMFMKICIGTDWLSNQGYFNFPYRDILMWSLNLQKGCLLIKYRIW